MKPTEPSHGKRARREGHSGSRKDKGSAGWEAGRSGRRITPKPGRRPATIPSLSASDLSRTALDLFADRHYSAVTIKDIGRAAGVNPAMIYYHFKNKEELFAASIQDAIDEAFLLFEQHCQIDHHEDAMAAISAWFDIHVILHKRLRNVVKISLDANSLTTLNPNANQSIKDFYKQENEILQSYIVRGVDSGLFQSVDPTKVATMISTSLDGIMAHSLILEDFDMMGTVEEFKMALASRLGLKSLSSSRDVGNQ